LPARRDPGRREPSESGLRHDDRSRILLDVALERDCEPGDVCPQLRQACELGRAALDAVAAEDAELPVDRVTRALQAPGAEQPLERRPRGAQRVERLRRLLDATARRGADRGVRMRPAHQQRLAAGQAPEDAVSIVVRARQNSRGGGKRQAFEPAAGRRAGLDPPLAQRFDLARIGGCEERSA
jgi:hypothetical protein